MDTHGKAMKTDEPSTPIFLRKTFEMITTCDPSLASWYDEGTTFVVKEPEVFASDIIPTYFKHSNFSSFVRQLNFYGFRKIKSDPLRLSEAGSNEEGRFWKFGHRAFIQNRPDLLPQIKKDKERIDGCADKNEVDRIKKDNEDLKRRVSKLTADVEQIKAMFPKSLSQREIQTQKHEKKQKLDMDDYLLASLTPLPIGSPFTLQMSGIQSEGIKELFARDDLSIGTIDENILASFPEYTDDAVGTAAAADDMKPPSAPMNHSAAAFVENEHSQKIRSALARLPPKMQTVFVSRMVEALCNPVFLQKEVDVVTSLAESAAEAAHYQATSMGHEVDETKVTAIGSYILDSFFKRNQNVAYAEQYVPSKTSFRI